MPYLAYDVRGIQAFIFAIPRLKYVVGGSALIDRFDRDTVDRLARAHGWQRVASAGGKGAFRVRDAAEAGRIQERLVTEAHGIGLDIRFGRDDDYSEAAQTTDRLFPYLPAPDELDGHPCPESGLYPVTVGERHPVVARRLWQRGDLMTRWFERRLLLPRDPAHHLLPDALQEHEVAFFHDTEPDSPGHASLGKRSRWAVICMDGNDMGSQFRAMATDRRLADWLGDMSTALDDCAHGACVAGMRRVLEEWLRDGPDLDQCREEGEIILPLRPLVVGGDDITVLCDARYATSFVSAACARFSERSREHAQRARPEVGSLWPATGDALSISAGILYAPVTLPLATAVRYAEDLLASAKQRGRREQQAGQPAPACVDWESVTEGLLDRPHTRRQRELVFLDGDLSADGAPERVELTRRPSTLADFEGLLRFAETELGRVPASTLHRLLPALRAGYHDRQIFRARLGKHERALFDCLDESAAAFERPRRPAHGRWRRTRTENGWTRSTDLIDAVLLLQEQSRVSREGER